MAVWNMHSSSKGIGSKRKQHPDLNVTMRSWLERPTAAAGSNSSTAGFATAGVQQASSPSHASARPAVAAGGVMLQELHAAQSDPGGTQQPVLEGVSCLSRFTVVHAAGRVMMGCCCHMTPEHIVRCQQQQLFDAEVDCPRNACLLLPACRLCAEVLPSPLFSAQGPYQQHLSLRGPSSNTAAAAPAVPAPVRCSWLLGLNASAHGSLLWLRQRGLVAHPAGTVLVLTDLASHSQRHLQHHSLPISAAAASSDGCLLATAPAGPEPASGCAEVCVWDAATGTLRHVLRQHACGVGLLAFSPDGCWLASVSAGGNGGLLVLWDLQAGEAAAVGKTQKVGWNGWQSPAHCDMVTQQQRRASTAICC